MNLKQTGEASGRAAAAGATAKGTHATYRSQKLQSGRLSSPLRSIVIRKCIHPGALSWSSAARRSSTRHPCEARKLERTRRDANADGASKSEEAQEPHKLHMQPAGGGRDQGQKHRVLLQVVEAVLRHLALGSVDERTIGVLSMTVRAMTTDRHRLFMAP